jgi:hypothetical protein
MIEFGKFLEDYKAQLIASRLGFREGWEQFHNAKLSYNEATKLRQQILQDILKEKGLAPCAGIHPDRGKGIEKPTLEDLGIYPRSVMRLLYHEHGPYDIQREYGDSTGYTLNIKLLCPDCYPKDLKGVCRREGGYTRISSEVIVEDGKYTLAVDGSDITNLATKGGRDIDIDGLKLFLLDAEIYRYFGIPDLPEEPDLNSVQHST